MPTYDYKCKTCGETFEYTQKFSDSPLTKCPEGICKSENPGQGDVMRVFSKNVGLVFKGSGFYLTDYTNKTKSTDSKSDSCSTSACGCVADAKAS